MVQLWIDKVVSEDEVMVNDGETKVSLTKFEKLEELSERSPLNKNYRSMDKEELCQKNWKRRNHI